MGRKQGRRRREGGWCCWLLMLNLVAMRSRGGSKWIQTAYRVGQEAKRTTTSFGSHFLHGMIYEPRSSFVLPRHTRDNTGKSGFSVGDAMHHFPLNGYA